MAEIFFHSVFDILKLDGDTLATQIKGYTSDISHLCEIAWYDHVWYIDQMDMMQNKI
jgi:hypothetical protein